MAEINAGILIILGAAIFGGTLGAALFQRLRIPQVVGYICLGIIIGKSGFGIVADAELSAFQGFNLFALALIGFLVGGELHIEHFRRYGRQFLGVLLGEGLGAFFFVGIPIVLLVYAMVGSWAPALAAGLVFGAIASATDPATTADVLWEYRGKGVLTTTLLAMVALDDALAMTLYGVGSSLAQMLTGQEVSLLREAGMLLVELPGACALGVVSGLVLHGILKIVDNREKSLAFAVGILLLVIGLAVTLNMDVILAAMALGITLCNMAPHRSKELFQLVRTFSLPIYVLFFVMVGARLSVTGMPGWLWVLVAIYVLGRGLGKMAGGYLGGRISNAEPVVQRYAGMGLFAQGGIAVGLSIMAGERLSDVPLTADLALGEAVIFAVTATTVIIQIVGPGIVKLSIKLADEIGRNVTEEDVIASLSVADVMDDEVEAIGEFQPLTRVVNTLSQQDHSLLPVVDRNGAITGMVSLDGLKEVFAHQDVWEWLVARDVLETLPVSVTSDMPLAETRKLLVDRGIEQVIVLAPGPERHLAGVYDSRRTRKRIQEALLQRQKAVYAKA